MSVIYNALKKTQETRSNNQEANTKTTVLDSYKTTNNPINWIKRGAIIYSIMIMAVLIVLAVFQRSFITHLPNLIVAESKVLPTNIAMTSKLVLNGVFVSKSTKIAMINHQTYSLGDTVNGKKIVSINFNKVILQEGNTKEVLHRTV